jgi:hypothetical protein
MNTVQNYTQNYQIQLPNTQLKDIINNPKNIKQVTSNTQLQEILEHNVNLLLKEKTNIENINNNLSFLDLANIINQSILCIVFCILIKIIIDVNNKSIQWLEPWMFNFHKLLGFIPIMLLIYRYRYLIILQIRLFEKTSTIYDKIMLYVTLIFTILNTVLSYTRSTLLQNGNTKLYLTILIVLLLLSIYKLMYEVILYSKRSKNNYDDITVLSYVLNTTVNDKNLSYFDTIMKLLVDSNKNK